MSGLSCASGLFSMSVVDPGCFSSSWRNSWSATSLMLMFTLLRQHSCYLSSCGVALADPHTPWPHRTTRSSLFLLHLLHHSMLIHFTSCGHRTRTQSSSSMVVADTNFPTHNTFEYNVMSTFLKTLYHRFAKDLTSTFGSAFVKIYLK